ncbi:MAG: endonuclease/exonuclease/phosphatase family protein [Bacteroidota bacterium]
MRNLVKYTLLIINAISVVALLLGYAALHVPPDQMWYLAAAGLAYPYVLTINLLFCVFWLLMRPRFILLSLIAILLGFNVTNRFYQLNGKNTDEQGVKVVSYNVKHFTGTGRNPSRELAELIKSFLKENQPDIICLQEVKLRTNSVFNLEATRKELPSIRHYQYARTSSTGGSVTMSRFPILKMQEIRFENSGNIAIATDILAGEDTIRVFNVHLQSYQIDPERYKIIESPMLSSEQDLREARELGSKFRRAVKMRAVQARLIRAKIDECPYPVIVCGDFNDSPASYAYQQVRGNLKDAFVCSGQGIGQTYIGKLPSFRIDYILHSRRFKSYNFTTYDVPYSDHLPVSCDLIVAR